MTFKIFADQDEEFNLVPRTRSNIEKLAIRFLECEGDVEEDAQFFMSLAGIDKVKVKKKYKQDQWLEAVGEILFIEKPKIIGNKEADWEVLREAYDFFLNSFGAIPPDVQRNLQSYQITHLLNRATSREQRESGEKPLMQNMESMTN